MESQQGAGFAFDMNNMDFSNVFAAKPVGDETSTSFLFGDEAIDTTTSLVDPIIFPQQNAFDMPLPISLDDTSVSASGWPDQFTTQSFDSIYSPAYTNAYGKRPLQVDHHDFPQSKRHEMAGDFSLFPPASAPSWPLDAQLTPTSSIELGISDEAADICATWFNKYSILPSDCHIDSLSQLTGESADAIRHWFGRLVKQGMNTSQVDSAYRSQTALPQSDQFRTEAGSVHIPQLLSEESTQASLTTFEASPIQEVTAVAQAAKSLRKGKKSRCTPTEDISQMSRDPSKIYQCTRKCGKRYGRKCDWKRNEEEGYPCKSWVCSLCTSSGVDNVKPCFRKYHFAQHFRNIHPGVNCDDHEETSIVCSETEFPRRCGFCKHRFESRQERIDHIAEHFKQGKCMLDWMDGEGCDNSGNANDSDDDNDDPSGNDSESSTPPHPPPPHIPRGGSNGGDGSQGGYFQFQLSQLNESEAGTQPYYAQHQLKPIIDVRGSAQRTRCSSEPPNLQSPTIGKPSAAEGDDTVALARDALPGPLALMSQLPCSSQYCPEPLRDDQNMEVIIVDAVISATAKAATPMFCTGSKHEMMKATDVVTTARLETLVSANTFAAEQQTTKLAHQFKVKASPTHWRHKCVLTRKQTLQNVRATSQSFLSVRFLGSGGFSTVDEVVHRGTKLRLGRKTLKNRDPAAVEELWKEVNVLQKLHHPHVIRFLGAYSQGDKMSMLLSPIADTTLSLWLDRFTLKKPDNFGHIITKMFGCLLSSVRYLHEQRPVVKHLDIKPQNILIVEGDGEYPHVVLCDFGISTSDDVCKGRPQPLTRQYVAPEVFGGNHGTCRTPAADIWSLGCVFAEMASLSFGQDNSKWAHLRKEFSGKAGKYYWQDVSGLQCGLTALLEDAATTKERTVVRTLQAMLRREPTERPDAASLTLIFSPASCCLSWPNANAAYPGPQEELKLVEALVHEEGMDCSSQTSKSSRMNTAPCQDLSDAQNWLEQCSHSHEACMHADLDGPKTLPTRLVDLRPGDGTSGVRVVTSASIEASHEPIEYITLSHMWSHSHTMLTTDKLESMQTNIALGELSDALNSAITAAQALGFRYLWTDSLCVIHDKTDSKQEECAKMASTFRNAALTLVLDAIDHGVEEFREGLANKESAFAWDTRAWTLQERLLSHRFLYIGQEQMYWECNSLKASQTFPQGLPLLVWEKAHSKPASSHATWPGQKETTPLHKSRLAPMTIGTCADGDHGPANDCGSRRSAPTALTLFDVDGRRGIKSSGQMERHGSRNGRLRDESANGDGDGNGNGNRQVVDVVDTTKGPD
ncbi:protein kinase D signaling [Pleosporales sp. CAS-2024a]